MYSTDEATEVQRTYSQVDLFNPFETQAETRRRIVHSGDLGERPISQALIAEQHDETARFSDRASERRYTG